MIMIFTPLLLLSLLSLVSSSIFWDPDYDFVTTTTCNVNDTAQHWTLNDTSLSIWSNRNYHDEYGQRSRCLSLAPNALYLDISNHQQSSCEEAKIGRVGHLQAYDSNFFGKQCLERLQIFDHWNGEQYYDFANVVTRNCDEIFYKNTDGTSPWLNYQTIFSAPLWKYDNGYIVNTNSGKCLQIGGSVDQQCDGSGKNWLKNKNKKIDLATAKETYLKQTTKPKSASNNIATPSTEKEDYNDPHPYISAVASPAVLMPCNSGCAPEKMQQWEKVEVQTSLSSSSPSSSSASSTVMFRLRSNHQVCLRSGVDWNTVSTWQQSYETWIAAAIALVPMILAFWYELKYLKSQKYSRLLLFGDKSIGVLVIRIISSFGGIVQVFFWKAISLSNKNGGRGFYPRQVIVHGTLFSFNLLFIHVMLVSRMKTVDERRLLFIKRRKIWERYMEIGSEHHHHSPGHAKGGRVREEKTRRDTKGETKGETTAETDEPNESNEIDVESYTHTNHTDHSTRSLSHAELVAVPPMYCWAVILSTCYNTQVLLRRYCFERPTVFIHFLYLIIFRMASFYEMDFGASSSFVRNRRLIETGTGTGTAGRSLVDDESASWYENWDGALVMWIGLGIGLYTSFMQIASSIAEIRSDEKNIKEAARTRHSLELAQMEGKNIHEGEKSLSSTEDTSNSSRDDVSIMDEDDDEMIEGIDHFGSFHNTEEMHSSDYTSRFFQRWSIIIFIQMTVFISSFFSPNGPPNWFPTIQIDFLVLSLVMETLLGTIKQRTFRAWASKYHVAGAIIFCIPLIFICAWEGVAIVMGSYSTTGQKNMQNSGQVGGYSNQIRGPNGSVGWWWGKDQSSAIAITTLCVGGLVASMNILPSFIRWLGIRGAKAPLWLEDLLVETDGHVPRPRDGNEYHFFFSKHERYKKWAVDISKVLVQCGFKVWLSQFQQNKGNEIDSEGMQKGVKISECLLLLLTDGIFSRDRHWVTQTEVTYGVVECNKPLIALLPAKFKSLRSKSPKTSDSDDEANEGSSLLNLSEKDKNLYLRSLGIMKDSERFDLDTKCHNLQGCVHPKACCHDVDEEFQPLARAIPIALNIASWRGRIGRNTSEYLRVRESVRELVKRYLDSHTEREKLSRETIKQKKLGVCTASGGRSTRRRRNGNDSEIVELTVTEGTIGENERKTSTAEKGAHNVKEVELLSII